MEVTAIVPMDNFLLVFCAKSIWCIPDGPTLPDATGSNGFDSCAHSPALRDGLYGWLYRGHSPGLRLLVEQRWRVDDHP